jgi:hypothetical protein
MPARERLSQENAGTHWGLLSTTVAGGRGGEGSGFSYLLELHMTYLARSHIPRSWPVIQLSLSQIAIATAVVGGSDLSLRKS